MLCQLSYAPGVGIGIVPAGIGHPPCMSETEREGTEPDDARHAEEDELLEAQEHKGYGEDEGEREAALDEE